MRNRTRLREGVQADWIRRKRRTWWQDFLYRLFTTKPLGAAGLLTVILLLLTAALANFLAPFDYRTNFPDESLQPYSLRHWLGTDQLGRDLLSRIIWGARVSMIVAFAAVVVSTLITLLIGMTSGYLGGTFDLVVQRFVDSWLVLPTLLILIVLVGVFGQSIASLIAVLSIDRGISTSRVIRGEVISLKTNTYIEAARVIGVSTPRLMVVHMLPNLFAPTIVLATIGLGWFILAEASLSFLGMGIPPPFPTWGQMLSGSGLAYMHAAPWMALWPGVALSLAVFAFNILGDAMRDLLDPRLRGTR